MAITDSLISFWGLEEASGTRYDLVGTNHLTPVNTPGNIAGKVSNAATFVKASSQHLDIADNASIGGGAIDFAFNFWLLLPSAPTATGTIFCKDDGTGAARDYNLQWDNGAGQLIWYVWNGAGTIIGNVPLTITFTPNLWYMVTVDHQAGNSVGIRINGGARTSVATTGSAGRSAQGFRISGTPAGNYIDMRVDEFGFWKRILTQAEITQLYAAGNCASSYPFTLKYHVALDGQGYIIDPATYEKKSATQFSHKTRAGDAAYADLTYAAVWEQKNWLGGFGYSEYDGAATTRFSDALSVDTSFGDLRLGRTLTSVFTTETIYQIAVYAGALYAIAVGTGASANVYVSTNGTSWSLSRDLNVVSACVSLRSIAIFGGNLYVGAGDSGKVFKFDGTTWTLWATVANATAIRSLAAGFANSVNSLLGGASGIDVTGAANTRSAVLGIFNTDGSGFAIINAVDAPHIEAILAQGHTHYFAPVDDTTGISGSVWSSAGVVGDKTLVVALPDNAVSSFALHKAKIYAGSRTRGKVWELSSSGLTPIFQVWDTTYIGGYPQYTPAIRALLSLNDRLYFPVVDTQGLGVYQFDGVGWGRLATGGSGTTPGGLAALNGDMYVSSASGSAVIYRMPQTYPTTGRLITGWFDAGLPTITKPLGRVAITHSILTTGQSIQVEYALDDATGWTNLGTSSTVGAATATFAFAANTNAKRIRFRYTLTVTTTTASPSLKTATLEFFNAIPLKREWDFDTLLEGTAGKMMVLVDGSSETQTGVQLSAALWASKAKQQTLGYTDLDGLLYTVLFEQVDERPSPQSREYMAQRAGYTIETRGKVHLVEA